jgi:uncharacterized membrane protein YdcZ (DUF606 family)
MHHIDLVIAGRVLGALTIDAMASFERTSHYIKEPQKNTILQLAIGAGPVPG